MPSIGEEMHALVTRLFPIPRSITGDGVRETLRIIKEHIPLEIHEVPSGFVAFDWVVPPEWNIRAGWIARDGEKLVDFQDNSLHVVGYSMPVNRTMPLAELQQYLHSRPDLPNAIPYVTSYYERRWGFCLTHRQREKLKPGNYRVLIHSHFNKKGHLTYADIVIPGKLKDEIFLSTYVCHPRMANNELSGPVVATFLAKWLLSEPRRYTYRIAFVPETIGALVYLRLNFHALTRNVKAGFVVTCIGDDRAYSYLPSRKGVTLADRVALLALKPKKLLSWVDPYMIQQRSFLQYTYLDRGSDERQYCAPGVDLPMCSVMRSKYGTYPEYHTSLDDLSLVTPAGLEGGYNVLRDCLDLLERNKVFQTACLGEPFLSRHGLYPTLSTHESARDVKAMMDFLAYCDGETDVVDICNIILQSPQTLYPIIEKLEAAGLIREGW